MNLVVEASNLMQGDVVTLKYEDGYESIATVCHIDVDADGFVITHVFDIMSGEHTQMMPVHFSQHIEIWAAS
jgi:hypothetical protein